MSKLSFLDIWVNKNFGVTLEQFVEKMKSKPLREMVSVFNNDNTCTHKCSHCLMVEKCEYEDRLTVYDYHKIYSLKKSPSATIKSNYTYMQNPEQHIDTLYEILKKSPQWWLEFDVAAFVKDPSIATRFKKLGVEWIAHSLHGDYAESRLLTNETKEEWDNKIKGFKIAKQEGFNVEISTTFYKDIIDNVDGLVDILNYIGVTDQDSWSTNRVIPIGRAKEWPKEKFLHGEACDDAVRKIAKSVKKLNGKKSFAFDITWGPNFYGSTTRGLMGERGDFERGVYNCHISSDVLLDIKNIWISRYTGHIYSCLYAIGDDYLCIGKYKDGRLYLDQEKLKAFLPENRLGKLKNRCAPENCEFSKICVGCPYVSYAFHKKYNSETNLDLNVGMDFCITDFISKNSDNESVMNDFELAIQFKP